jgi:hypothetical protein
VGIFIFMESLINEYSQRQITVVVLCASDDSTRHTCRQKSFHDWSMGSASNNGRPYPKRAHLLTNHLLMKHLLMKHLLMNHLLMNHLLMKLSAMDNTNFGYLTFPQMRTPTFLASHFSVPVAIPQILPRSGVSLDVVVRETSHVCIFLASVKKA